MSIQTQTFLLDRNQKFTLTDEGYLTTKARLTRTGVFDYGKFKRYRPPEEVFKPESLDSLKLKPITFHHPKSMVDSENINKYTVGVIGQDVMQDGEYIVATVTIHSKPAVDYVLEMFDKGKEVELSCGYFSELVDREGTIDGQGDYNQVQTEIRYNHVSIVEKGRAGEQVKLLLDSINTTDEGGTMPDETKIQLDAATAQLDELKKEKDTLQAQYDAITAQIDAVKLENEKLIKELETWKNPESAEVRTMLDSHKMIMDSIEKFGVDAKGKALKDAKLECIKKTFENFDEKEKSDDYLNATFDAAIKFNEEITKIKNNNKIAGIKQPVTTQDACAPKKKSARDEWKEELKKPKNMNNKKR